MEGAPDLRGGRSLRTDVAGNLAYYLHVLRRRGPTLALIAALVVGAGAAVTFRQRPVYRATAKIVVGQGNGAFLPQVGSATEPLTQTMSNLISSNIVASLVIGTLHLPMSTTTLLAHLHVATLPSTGVLEVSYDDTDARRGRDILGSVGAVFTQQVSQRLSPQQAGSPLDPALSATVFDPAHTLPGHVKPTPVRNLAVAGLVGLALGLITVLLQEQAGDRIHTVDQAERLWGHAPIAVLGGRCLGHEQFLKGHVQVRRALARRHSVPASPENLWGLEALQAVLRWSPQFRGIRTILLSSSGRDEGRTTVAVSLAVALANEGADVIVVDADAARPCVHRFLDLGTGPQTHGIGALLSDTAPLEAALVEVPDSRWSLSPTARPPRSGKRPPEDPGESPMLTSPLLLGAPAVRTAGRGGGRLRALLAPPGWFALPACTSDRAKAVVAELRSEADYVIVDGPPMQSVGDAYLLLASVDMLVEVIRLEHSSATSIIESQRILERMPPPKVELVVTGA